MGGNNIPTTAGMKTTSSINLDNCKIKKSFMMKLFMGSGKIDDLNNKMSVGQTKTNSQVGSTNPMCGQGNEITAEGSDDAGYAIEDNDDADTIAARGDEAGEAAAADAAPTIDGVTEVCDIAEQRGVDFQAQEENTLSTKEEVMEALGTEFEALVMLGDELANIMTEMDAIEAEVDADSASGGAGGGAEGGAAGGFSTDMAAAGGQNSAYTLSNIGAPAQQAPAKAPAKGGKKQGGLISSGAPAQAPQQTQGAQGGQPAQGAQGSQGGQGGDLSAKLAKLDELAQRSSALNEEMEVHTATMIDLQTQYATMTETEIGTTEAINEDTNGQLEETSKTAKFFEDTAKIGDDVTKYADTAKTIFENTDVVAQTIDKGGITLKTLGKCLKNGANIAAGIASILMPNVYTAAAGAVVKGAEGGMKGGGTAADAAGQAMSKTGKAIHNVCETGKEVATGVKAVGEGVSAFGHGGAAVTAVAEGRWMDALAQGLACAGSAMACVADTKEFMANMDTFKTTFSSTTTAAQERMKSIREKLENTDQMKAANQQIRDSIGPNAKGSLNDALANKDKLLNAEYAKVYGNSTSSMKVFGETIDLRNAASAANTLSNAAEGDWANFSVNALNMASGNQVVTAKNAVTDRKAGDQTTDTSQTTSTTQQTEDNTYTPTYGLGGKSVSTEGSMAGSSSKKDDKKKKGV